MSEMTKHHPQNLLDGTHHIIRPHLTKIINEAA
jgi:hypothetical protein